MKFQKQEETVSAFQFNREELNKAPEWFKYNDLDLFGTDRIIIGCYDKTDRIVNNGDWIILSKDGIFSLTDQDFKFIFKKVNPEKRDMLMNPMPGDIFQSGKHGDERHVLEWQDLTVEYRDIRISGDHGIVKQPIEDWRKWAKKAKPKIVQRYEDL